MDQLERSLSIAWKDIRVYYLKAPNFTYGLLMPVALYMAFSVAGNLQPETLISGLVSLVVLFGSTSIEAVAVVSERTSGTFERLLVAPVTLRWILFGKALAGAAFGPVTAILALIPVVLISGTSVASPVLLLLTVAVSSLTFACLGILASAYAKWIPDRACNRGGTQHPHFCPKNAVDRDKHGIPRFSAARALRACAMVRAQVPVLRLQLA